MFSLSDGMCAEAGLPQGTSAAAFLEHLRDVNPDMLDGLLASEASKVAAEESLHEFSFYKIKIVGQNQYPDERYCSILFEAHTSPMLIGLMPSADVLNPSTALENLIFWALSDPHATWQRLWREGRFGPILNWRDFFRGKAIVAEPIGITSNALRLTSALFKLDHADISHSSPSPALAIGASRISVSGPVDEFNATQSRLVYEAATATQPKWRCLSLYRILENAYLSNVKLALLREFDQDATRAVEDAKKKLSSEVGQLLDLAEKSGLAAEFETFGVEVGALIAAGNAFATMLDRSAKADSLYGQGGFKKAVLLFYKLRCSIAHAGTSSVIFEQFSDSNLAALALLPSIEAIALKSLKISILA